MAESHVVPRLVGRYPGNSHRSISKLEGMEDRTVTLHSASKLLGVTGWRVGWVVGPANITAAITTAHSYMTYVRMYVCMCATVHVVVAVFQREQQTVDIDDAPWVDRAGLVVRSLVDSRSSVSYVCVAGNRL